jgi:biopolymer transport protein TolR
MAMATSNNKANDSRRRRGRRYQPMSEINVTPFVDVMLVLLIIFMVTAPLLTVGVPLDMPETRAGAVNADTRPITISVNGGGQIFLQETEISLAEVTAKLRAISQMRQGEETRIFLRGDKAVAYDIIAQVLADISSAGFRKITLSSLPADGQ